MEERRPDSTREKILRAATVLIGREGVKAVTVRRIAKLAGVNGALIHYHFQSKENIVNEAVGAFFSHLSDIFDRLKAPGEPPEERLRSFILDYIGHFLDYPGIFVSQIQYLIERVLLPGAPPQAMPEDAIPALFAVIAQGAVFFRKTLSEYSGITDEKTLSMEAVRMMTSVAHPILLTGLPGQLFGIDFRDAHDRLKYTDLVIRSAKHA